MCLRYIAFVHNHGPLTTTSSQRQYRHALVHTTVQPSTSANSLHSDFATSLDNNARTTNTKTANRQLLHNATGLHSRLDHAEEATS